MQLCHWRHVCDRDCGYCMELWKGSLKMLILFSHFVRVIMCGLRASFKKIFYAILLNKYAMLNILQHHDANHSLHFMFSKTVLRATQFIKNLFKLFKIPLTTGFGLKCRASRPSISALRRKLLSPLYYWYCLLIAPSTHKNTIQGMINPAAVWYSQILAIASHIF
jgi:hypothetical protein